MKNTSVLFSAIIAEVCFLIANVFAASANITGLIFTTAPQTVSVAAVSGVRASAASSSGFWVRLRGDSSVYNRGILKMV